MRLFVCVARLLMALFLFALAATGLVACRPPGESAGAPGSSSYFCPMHPEIVSERPGTCPVCQMDLVRRDDGAAAGQQVATDGKAFASSIPGAARLAGVDAIEARAERVARTVRTVGRVVADERRMVRVESRFAGWIAELDADFTGRRVRRGERLATIDSPELYAAQNEYLAGREAARRFLASDLPEVRRGGDDLVLAARRRLELLNLPAESLAELERTRVPKRTLEVVAPASGIVTEKMVVRGQRIESGMGLFTIVDLSSIWIEASLYETDAAFARVGQGATITSSYDPTLRLEATASYLSPALDPEARTLRVRFQAANSDERLKPGMFVDVEIELGELVGVAVPDAAVLATGERTLVFVVDASGFFTPREVRLAGRQAGRTFVREGLASGERVASEAAFLLDADSRLRAVVGRAASEAAADPHAAHRGGAASEVRQ